MWGKVAVIGIVASAAVAGVLLYYTQEYAFYDPVSFTPGAEILLTPIVSGTPEPILADNVQGIDAGSSPLRFRACFTTPMDVAMLTETYLAYAGAEPLNAPNWFDCFDAQAIGAALETGEALAFLSQSLPEYGIDRVVAVFADGRGYAWNQMNACGTAFYASADLPADCPAPPPRTTP